MPLEKLVVMVKAPRPGRVKTRLARQIGDDAACRAYRELVERLFRNLSDLSDVELRFAPDDASAEIQDWLTRGWKACPQGEGDLGQRLQRVVRDSFATGRTRLVIVGSDCPWVEASDIREAWNALASDDLAIGPAHDGGYWLIGMSQPHLPLFEDIDWSTADVLSQTLSRARERGLAVHRLRTLSDVDERTDWEAYQAEQGRGEFPQGELE